MKYNSKINPSTALRVNGERSRTIKIFSIAFGIIAAFLYINTALIAENWQELKSEHFIAYFVQDKKMAASILDKAEVYYRKIALDLGYPRYSEFWTWDKRVKIYIYLDHASYLKATNQPEWSQGMADYTKKEILSYAWSRGFTESLLPHEIAHLIFRDFVGFKGEVPLWLDEGVAQWEEDLKRQEVKRLAKDLYDKDSLMALKDMMKINIRVLTDKDKVYVRSSRTKTNDTGVLFLSGENLINMYYLQSVSLVGFLIERYGSSSFAEFCRQLRDGKQLEEALSFAYPTYMRNIEELDDQWRKYLENGGNV